MKAKLAALAANPYTYILGCGFGGTVSVVAGVGMILGSGYAFVAAGLFLIGAASYIIKGLKPNG